MSEGTPLSAMDQNSSPIFQTRVTTEIDASEPLNLIPLEDCKCPICLDYYIDVVETGCHHRFCSFCLENWLRVSAHRQCPTCRSTLLASLPVKPELQDIINSSIQQALTEEDVRERSNIRLERQAQVSHFLTDREQAQALLARITSSRPRARYIRSIRRRLDLEPEANLISRQIMNWWDDNNVPAVVNPEPSRRDEVNPSLQQETEVEDLSLGFFRRVRDLNDHEDNFDSLPVTQEDVNPTPRQNWNIAPPEFVRNNQNAVYRRRASPHFDQSYHEDLMEEYSYHLRRVNSAHTRIREAYRDFNYHNSRMQEILQEHRSFFSGMRRSTDNTPANAETNAVTYEDFEDLIGAEMGELLDNSPAAQVVFGSLMPENRLGRSDVSHNFQNGRHTFTLDRNANNNQHTGGRNFRGNSRRNTNSDLSAHHTNVLDMENEIENRRHQLNRLSSLIRQCPWNSDSRYSGIELNTSSTPLGVPNEPASLSTPMQFVPTGEEFSRRNEMLRQSSGQHQIMVERGNFGIPPPVSRRMRRRIQRANMTRNDRLRTTLHAQNVPVPSVQNSFSENYLLPGTYGGVNTSNDGTGVGAGSDARLSNSSVASTTSEPNNEMASTSSNVVSDMSQTSRSVGWSVNESTDSEDERNRNSESAQQINTRSTGSLPITQRPMLFPTRHHASFRRALRFHRRRLNILNNENTDGSAVSAPASSSSNTNTSIVGERSSQLSNISQPVTNNDEEEARDRLVQTFDGADSLMESTSRTTHATEDAFLLRSTDNGNNTMPSNSIQECMNDYLNILRNQYKTR